MKKLIPILVFIIVLAYIGYTAQYLYKFYNTYEAYDHSKELANYFSTAESHLLTFEEINNEYNNSEKQDSLRSHWSKTYSDWNDHLKGFTVVDTSQLLQAYLSEADKWVNTTNNLFQVMVNDKYQWQRNRKAELISENIHKAFDELLIANVAVEEDRNNLSAEVSDEIETFLIYLGVSILGAVIFMLIYINILLFRKKSEKIESSLEQTESKLEYLYSHEPLFEMNLTDDGRIIDLNNYASAVIGMSRKKLKGKKFKDFLTDESQQTFVKRIRECRLKVGTVCKWNSEIKTGESKHVMRMYATSRSNKNGKLMILIDAKDITKEKETTEKISLADQILATIASIILVVDGKGSIRYVSPSVEKILGFTQEQLMGNGWWDYTWYAESAMAEEIKDAAKRASGEKSVAKNPYERFIKSKDGKGRWILWQEAKGNEDLLIGVGHDVTDTKLTEKALRDTESRYRQLFNGIKDPIIIHDMKSMITKVNEAASQLLGYGEEEINGLYFQELTSGNTKPIQMLHMDKICRGENIIMERTFVCKSGKKLYAEVNSGIISFDSSRYVLNIVRDITDRKQAEAQIRMLSHAVEQSPTSVMITTPEGNITYVNPRFSEMTGYAFDEVKGKNPRFLKSGKTPDKVYKEMWEAIVEGGTWYGEYQNKKKNGELFWELMSVSPIKNKRGDILQFLAVKEDITDRKEKEVELREAKLKAEEMNRLKSVFLENMSHEFRTPMISIIGYAEILRDELENHELHDIAENVYSGGKRLTNALNAVLDIAKIESGELELKIEKLNLRLVIDEVAANFKESAKNKGLILNCEYEESEYLLNIDKRLVEDIIANLIDNAVKYTDKGEVVIKPFSQDGYTGFHVVDSGIGIPGDRLAQIFEPFRQADEGTSRSYEGVGLGLTITKSFVEHLGGNITVNSMRGVGTTFTVKFPS